MFGTSPTISFDGKQVSFQSPSCGAVFGTHDPVRQFWAGQSFQSPSCGAVFGTQKLSLRQKRFGSEVSVAFMRRGVRDRNLQPKGNKQKKAVSVAFMRRGVRDVLSVKFTSSGTESFSRLHAARCSGPCAARKLVGRVIEFQSPSCGAVFGTWPQTSGRIAATAFQSPSCGAVFGTEIQGMPGSTDAQFQSPSCGAVFGTSCLWLLSPSPRALFQSPSCGAVFGTRPQRQKHIEVLRFSRLHAARCSGHRSGRPADSGAC